VWAQDFFTASTAMSSASGHAAMNNARKGAMPRSEFPPAPKSVRLFSVAEGAPPSANTQPTVCMATQPSHRNLGRLILTWAVLIAGFSVLLSWLGLFEPLARFITALGSHPGE
jgi:hypothetical protein